MFYPKKIRPTRMGNWYNFLFYFLGKKITLITRHHSQALSMTVYFRLIA